MDDSFVRENTQTFMALIKCGHDASHGFSWTEDYEIRCGENMNDFDFPAKAIITGAVTIYRKE